MNEDDKKEPPAWEFRSRLGLNDRLKDVVDKTRLATEAELATLRRKLEKLQRGS